MNKISTLHTLVPFFGNDMQKSLNTEDPRVVTFDHLSINDPTTYLGYKIGQNPTLNATKQFITSFVDKAGISQKEGQDVFQSLFQIYNSQGIGSKKLKEQASSVFTKDILGIENDMQPDFQHKQKNKFGR